MKKNSKKRSKGGCKSPTRTSTSKPELKPNGSSYYELSFSPGMVSTNAVNLPLAQRQVRGMDLRRSKRWSFCFPGVTGVEYEMPFIDRLGRFTGASVYTLACEPADVLSITTATVYGRLKRYCNAHNGWRVTRRLLREILRAAAWYTISKNSYFMDRILFFLRDCRNYGKLIHKTTLHYVAKGSADKRFVYGQVCYQTNWLIFRACRPRDKLPLIKLCDQHSPGFLGRPGSCRYGKVRSMSTALAERVASIGSPKGM
jgi:hypothetical protein